MLSRKNRRHKDSRPMFPFGEIMLPVIGLVALGILILSVKIFFMPSGNDKQYENIPENVSEKELAAVSEQNTSSAIATPDTKSTDSSNNSSDLVAVAVPVSESDSSVSTSRNNSAVKQGKNTSAGQSSTSAVQSDNRNPSVNEADGNSSWGVQIGSFKKTEAAESLSKQAKQKGYSVFIQQADVKGEKYHRVIVNAGNSQTRASEIEKNLKDDGFPTFLKRIR